MWSHLDNWNENKQKNTAHENRLLSKHDAEDLVYLTHAYINSILAQLFKHNYAILRRKSNRRCTKKNGLCIKNDSGRSIILSIW